MLSKEGQSSAPSSKNLETGATPQYESNLFKNKSNQGQKSALHSFKAPNNPVTSHSEMLPVHPDEALVMAKYTVYWINSKDNGKMYQLAVEWPHVEKVKEAIRDVIPYMNQKIAEDNSNYVLSLDPKQFEFYKARKNGEPKFDFPSLDMDETLSMTGIQRLTLVERSPEAVMLRSDLNKSTGTTDFKSERMQGPRTEINMNAKITKVPSIASRRTMEDNDEEFTESMCLCFKIRRRRARPNPLHQVDNLDRKLLQS